MINIENSNILTVGNNCDCSTFVPTITAIYAPSATIPNIIFTESSTIPGSDNFKSAVITVHDGSGNRKYGRIGNTGTANVMGAVTLTSTAITAIAITTAGSGYCGGGNGNLNLAITGGTGSGGTAYITVVAGVPTTVVITNGGSYTVAPTTVTIVPKSAVIRIDTGLQLAPFPISINANVATHGGSVATGVRSCEGDVFMYGITSAGTYVIGDSADERDLDTATPNT